jgi:hypothetical protein
VAFEVCNCVICGFYIIPEIKTINGKVSANWSRGKCKSCGRYAHHNCLEMSFIPSKAFLCKKIKYHLGLGGIDIVGFDCSTSVGQPPLRRQDMCLICGSDASEDNFKYTCNNDCKYSAHLQCIRVLCRVTDVELFDRGVFCCDLVEYHLKPSEVNSCGTLRVATIKEMRLSLKKRGKVKTNKYSMKRKRWLNDEVECEYCGRWYGVNEANHLGTYCPGMSSSALSQESRNYPFAQLKRFRHITWKVP